MRAVPFLAAAATTLLVAVSAGAHDRASRTTPVPPRDAAATAPIPPEEDPFLGTKELFFWRLAQINDQEIAAGKLAKEKSHSSDLTELGHLLVRDHGEAKEKLEGIAAAQNVDLAVEPPGFEKVKAAVDREKRHAEELKALRGVEFDRRFLRHMVEAHDKAIGFVTAYHDRTDDRTIRKHVEELLPRLRAHRNKAAEILEKVEPKDPERQDVRGVDKPRDRESDDSKHQQFEDEELEPEPKIPGDDPHDEPDPGEGPPGGPLPPG